MKKREVLLKSSPAPNRGGMRARHIWQLRKERRNKTQRLRKTEATTTTGQPTHTEREASCATAGTGSGYAESKAESPHCGSQQQHEADGAAVETMANKPPTASRDNRDVVRPSEAEDLAEAGE